VPEIREFIRQRAADVPLAEADGREVSNAVFRAMLDAAGPDGAVQVSWRTYPDYVEFDVLRMVAEPAETAPAGGTFADWITDVLRREGMSRQAAARQPGVSAKTVSRWAGGETEPRLRELRRIHGILVRQQRCRPVQHVPPHRAEVAVKAVELAGQRHRAGGRVVRPAHRLRDHPHHAAAVPVPVAVDRRRPQRRPK
jgi:transcriptional regulator with XRE-family HTH domain